MIAIVKFYPTVQGTNEAYQRQLVEHLNELLNQGYEVKAHSDWTYKNSPIVLLLHKKGPLVESTKACSQCGGRHNPADGCEFPGEDAVIPPQHVFEVGQDTLDDPNVRLG